MTKIYASLLLACICGAFRLNAGCLNDSLYTYTFNESNGLKELTGKTFYTFDGKGYMEGEVSTYFDAGKWFNNFKFIYTNNAKGKRTSRIFQAWDLTSNKWVNSEQVLYTYHGNDLLTERLFKTWDTASGTWINDQLMQHTYNMGGEDSILLSMAWINNQWENKSRVDYQWDGNGLKTGSITYTWNGSNWINSSRHVYTYSAGKETEDLSQAWQSGNWVNTNRRTSTYVAGKLSVILGEDWNNSAWTNSSQEIYDYDDLSCKLKIDYFYNWNMSTSQWDYHLQDSFFSSQKLSMDRIRKEEARVYPNPAYDMLYIEAGSATGYLLLDVSGRCVKQGELSEGMNSIHINDVVPGIYFLKTGESYYKILVQ